MSQRFDSTDYAARGPGLADVPARTAITIGAWVKLPASAPGSPGMVFEFGTNGLATTLGLLRWNSASSTFRLGHNNEGTNFSSNPSFDQWIYFFLQCNGSTLKAGWKTIAASSFTTQSNSDYGSGAVGEIRIGTGTSNTLAMDVFRASVWGEYVSEANLLLAAASDLGYSTNVNTHLPLTNGIGSPWNDTSGNSRNWTTSGTFSDQADPSLGASNVDLAGSATAGATASATLAVQRNLAAAAVAGALASGTLSVNKPLSGAAIGAAVGAAALTVFSSVWRIPTNAPNGTAVHATVFSGASPTYAILAQGTAIVAGGFVDIPGIGSVGAKAFAFVHNYADNTATSSIRGGPAIATLTSL
jgi:hypothetical protein